MTAGGVLRESENERERERRRERGRKRERQRKARPKLGNGTLSLLLHSLGKRSYTIRPNSRGKEIDSIYCWELLES